MAFLALIRIAFEVVLLLQVSAAYGMHWVGLLRFRYLYSYVFCLKGELAGPAH